MGKVRRALSWVLEPTVLRARKNLLRVLSILIISLASFSLKGFLDYYKNTKNFSAISELTTSVLPDYIALPLKSDPLLPPAFNLLLLFLFFVVFVLLTMFGRGLMESRRRTIPIFNLFRPAKEATDLLERQGATPLDYPIVGSIIEICRSRNIFSDLSISGWDCRSSKNSPMVTIQHKNGTEFLSQDISEIDQSRIFNGVKYSLVETPASFIGADEILKIVVQNTTFKAVQAVQNSIKSKPTLKVSHGSIYPETQRLANSLCLHMLVQLADGNIICMKRAGNTEYAPDKMSVSCEEQLSFDDMNSVGDEKVTHWFKRALCEEVFPLGDMHVRQLEANWRKIERRVTSMRVLSVVYEVDYVNYAIFGYIRINCTKLEFSDLYSSLAGIKSGRDKEGIIYLMSESDAMNFVKDGRARVSPLWGEEKIDFGLGTHCQAHPSTLYRLVFYLSAIGALKVDTKISTLKMV